MIGISLACIPFLTLLFLLLRNVRRDHRNDNLDKTKL